jgi:NADPH:quinone reductase
MAASCCSRSEPAAAAPARGADRQVRSRTAPPTRRSSRCGPSSSTSQLAVLPSTVSDTDAATLPTAALTALRALDLPGAHLAKRVLVTGASGGVGRYAVQLAALAGANVTALVRDVGKAVLQVHAPGP